MSLGIAADTLRPRRSAIRWDAATRATCGHYLLFVLRPRPEVRRAADLLGLLPEAPLRSLVVSRLLLDRLGFVLLRCFGPVPERLRGISHSPASLSYVPWTYSSVPPGAG